MFLIIYLCFAFFLWYVDHIFWQNVAFALYAASVYFQIMS